MTPPTTDPDGLPPRAEAPADAPEFGPRGYLPERAARRARKIMLREQMGLQWPIAAVLVALLLLCVGALYLWTRSRPPGPPYVAVGPIAAVDARGVATTTVDDLQLLVVRAGGGVRVFTGEVAGVRTCPSGSRVRDAGGDVYTVTGRALTGNASLQPVPSVVFDGVLYVAADPAMWPQPPPPAPAGTVQATC